MKLQIITINKIIFYLNNKKLSLKDLDSLNYFDKQLVFDKLYSIDLKIWKKKIIGINIDIESNFWKDVYITYPLFNINTFSNHYMDILITKKNEEKMIIYQYHNPLWEIYYKKSLQFNSNYK